MDFSTIASLYREHTIEVTRRLVEDPAFAEWLCARGLRSGRDSSLDRATVSLEVVADAASVPSLTFHGETTRTSSTGFSLTGPVLETLTLDDLVEYPGLEELLSDLAGATEE